MKKKESFQKNIPGYPIPGQNPDPEDKKQISVIFQEAKTEKIKLFRTVNKLEQ